MHSTDTVAEWATRIADQLRRFVAIDDSANSAVLVDNMQWTSQMSAVDFLRDVGKALLCQCDARRRRSAGDWRATASATPSSAMCCCSPTTSSNCAAGTGVCSRSAARISGGNIVGGVDLIRRVDGESAHAMTVPLVTSSDGRSSASPPAEEAYGSIPNSPARMSGTSTSSIPPTPMSSATCAGSRFWTAMRSMNSNARLPRLRTCVWRRSDLPRR